MAKITHRPDEVLHLLLGGHWHNLCKEIIVRKGSEETLYDILGRKGHISISETEAWSHAKNEKKTMHLNQVLFHSFHTKIVITHQGSRPDVIISKLNWQCIVEFHF